MVRGRRVPLTTPSGKPESRYTVLHRLASGGMADVYLAIFCGAHGFEKQTILKRMRAELVDNAEYRSMFIDEARLMASLSHANVVSVLDFGEGEDGIFLALEYVDGLDLARLLKRASPLAPDLAIYIGSCVLHALAYVHGHKAKDGHPLHIVHRDVSPSNVFLGRNGDVKLGDFGVAKMSRASVQTMPGTIKGKIAYMSPEQASAWDVDARSDLFSVGVVLFEALTGQRPFRANSDLELLRKLIQEAAPDPLAVAPSLPPALAGFLRKALANDRVDRFQSAEEMSRALLACAQGPAIGPGDVARLVASYARTEDALPAADPFAVALGLDAQAGGAQTVSRGETLEKDTVPSRPRRAPPAPRWPVAAALIAAVAVVGGSFALRPAPPAPPVQVDQVERPRPSPPRPSEPVVIPAVVTGGPEVDAGSMADAQPARRPNRAPRGKATLDVNSTPWAKVYLDGVFVGETAVTGLSVAVGKHRLRLHNPTVNKTWETSFELTAGEHRVIPVDLEAQGVAGKP